MSSDRMEELSRWAEVYDAARQRRAELDKAYKEKRAEIDSLLEKAKSEMLAIMHELDAKSLTLNTGTRIERVIKYTPRVFDWDSFLQFVDRHKAYDLLQRRVAQRNVLDYMKETDIVPPGLEVHQEYTLRLTKKKGD